MMLQLSYMCPLPKVQFTYSMSVHITAIAYAVQKMLRQSFILCHGTTMNVICSVTQQRRMFFLQ